MSVILHNSPDAYNIREYTRSAELMRVYKRVYALLEASFVCSDYGGLGYSKFEPTVIQPVRLLLRAGPTRVRRLPSYFVQSNDLRPFRRLGRTALILRQDRL